jgi:hypothetical protein
MSLDLTLTAPPDLSIGRIRLTVAESEIGGWVASPTEMQHRFESLNPGVYQAVAEPLGQPSRSFLFLLNESNRQVAMPSLQAMSSPGFVASNVQAVAGTILRSVAGRIGDSLQNAVEPALSAIVDAGASQPIALGLSLRADFERGSSRPYASGPPPEITLIEGAVEVVLNRPENDLATQSFNLMLTCAVGGGHNLFVRVPLFAGGVRLACSASPLGAADITSRVLPADRNRRAITQALFAGSSTEAAHVFKTIPGGPEELIGREDWRDDPWTSVAACLLCFRFPDLAPASLPVDLPALATRYPSLPDAHVLLARERLRQAARTNSKAQDRSTALDDALKHLQRGYDAGPPYFAYAAQLAEEMLGALATDKAVGQSATSQLAWSRRYPNAARKAGASYAWRSAEIPSKPGTLDPRSATVVFSGWVNHDRIALEAKRASGFWTTLAHVLDVAKSALGHSEAPASPTEAHAPSDPPALSRPVAEADDPHKGRFGGKDGVSGFTLAARFADTGDANTVGITLSVSGESGFESYDEVAEFFLHPTFRPSRLRAAFHGRKAEVRIVSWGGFTVGVWLPKRGIELELDLAKIPGAPRIVREL